MKLLISMPRIAMTLERKLRWDPLREESINDAHVNQLLDRAKRLP
ncbi:MAG: hypothetical protein R6V12_10545 [Candidatus Hydrogenedentota bacterium]